jgi:hypothetical protein
MVCMSAGVGFVKYGFHILKLNGLLWPFGDKNVV